jgi:small nuclear ribonucleoprotein (snRNP)-like protein
LKSGELYRGTLVEAEDNWNCQLTNVSHTARDGARFHFRFFFYSRSSVCRRSFPREGVFESTTRTRAKRHFEYYCSDRILRFLHLRRFSFLSSRIGDSCYYYYYYYISDPRVFFILRIGKHSSLENCYLRGSKIRMVIVPDMLKNAPMFKKIDPRTKSVLAGGGGKK